MKKLIVLFLLLISTKVNALTLDVLWSYPAEMSVKSFRLYLDGKATCDAPDGIGREMLCKNVTLTVGKHSATLTAVMLDGSESPSSAPYPLQYPVSGNITPMSLYIRYSIPNNQGN